MIGKKSGVAVLLKQLVPDLIVWHCSNHRLELAVLDASSDNRGIQHLQSFFDLLYSTYHSSPKNMNELRQAATHLEGQLLRVGKLLGVRWVASSERSVGAVWKSFPVLAKHFRRASTDETRTAADRRKYSGLLERLTSSEFVKNLAITYDAPTELAYLSTQLQRREMTMYMIQSYEGRFGCLTLWLIYLEVTYRKLWKPLSKENSTGSNCTKVVSTTWR